jgi:hypothetical protein
MLEVEGPETEADVMRQGAAILAERLPAGWSAQLTTSPKIDRRIDGLIQVSSADGQAATLVVEAKRVVEGRDVEVLREQLGRLAEDLPNGQGVVVARYLSPPVRARLTKAGLSYIDATGNVRVEVRSPGLFLSDRGADSDPWRGPGRPRGTLKGEPAAKIVRAIADLGGPWTIRELVDVAKTSTGATYRVVEFLEREAMATRDENGLIEVPDWAQVLRRWSDDYSFVRDNRINRFIAPRGLPDLMKRIGSTDTPTRYAVTGTIAAAEWAAYAPARMAMIYVASADEAAGAWDLRPAEAGANVLLAEPKYDVVFERAPTGREDVTVAAPTQVVVDLMTGPGRNPSEAEELLEWMKRNEQSWR